MSNHVSAIVQKVHQSKFPLTMQKDKAQEEVMPYTKHRLIHTSSRSNLEVKGQVVSKEFLSKLLKFLKWYIIMRYVTNKIKAPMHKVMRVTINANRGSKVRF